ncbi:MAG TPA: hypothetical protein VK662_14650 [Acidothermaceae bacterium]|nr:hypothetical protein [Acidothermaceae bacterium]
MTAWRDLVDQAAGQVGPVSPTLARHLRTELDEVEGRVGSIERSAPRRSAGDGLHALVALATARVADSWDPGMLSDVATAVELAYRASLHHRVVTDARGAGRRFPNTTVVLDGDWSITQAAVLVADIGPAAYRILVRGYGATQVGQLSGVADPLSLMRAAVALGTLVAVGIPAGLQDQADTAQRLWQDAGLAPSRRSTPAAVLAWAVGVQSAEGTTKARRVPVPAPVDVHPPSRSTTTSPAVGRS